MKNIQVKSTTKYDKFTQIGGNRELNDLHIKRLKDSMEEEQLIVPIIVNELFQIIDGQHRLEVCKQLLIPVYYIVINGYGLNQVHRLNTNQKNWTAEDYLEGYCRLGYEDYIVYRDFKTKYGFSNSICMALLKGKKSESKPTFEQFKNGTFKVANLKQGEKYAEMLLSIKPHYDGYSRRSFVFALIGLFDNKYFDFNIFLKKLSYQSTKLVDCSTTGQYLKVIEGIYNFKSQNKVRLY